ncbi:MAG TPA: hypothetical protein PK762_08655 [Candidatus Kapabacteria bacterium]|nr:hypothetical protein [Candidatus Kapabacteria bacterium]
MKKNQIKISKFGGRALSEVRSFSAMADIIKNQINSKQLIIISALVDTTRMLKQAAFISENSSLEDAKLIINNILEKHIFFATSIIHNQFLLNDLIYILNKNIDDINNILHGICITNELTSRTLDLVMSYGEKLALQLVYFFLKQEEISIAIIDAEDLIVTNNRFNYASPLYEDTSINCEEKLFPLFNDYQVVLTQGFVGKSKSTQQTTTLGLESSNLSAALLASIFNAHEITFWTDVEGFRSCDPKFALNTKLIKSISYQDAKLLAINGFKLIFPQMIDIAINSKIKLFYKSIFSVDGDYTEIPTFNSVENVTHIIYKIDHIPVDCINNDSIILREKKSNMSKNFHNSYSKICIFNSNIEKLLLLLPDIYKMNSGNPIHFNIKNDFKIQEIILKKSISNQILEHIHNNL